MGSLSLTAQGVGNENIADRLNRVEKRTAIERISTRTRGITNYNQNVSLRKTRSAHTANSSLGLMIYKIIQPIERGERRSGLTTSLGAPVAADVSSRSPS